MKCACKTCLRLMSKIDVLNKENISLQRNIDRLTDKATVTIRGLESLIRLEEENSQLRKKETIIFWWMYKIMSGKVKFSVIDSHLKNKIDSDELRKLYDAIFKAPKHIGQRALIIIYYLYGINKHQIAKFLFLFERTIRNYVSRFKKGGVDRVLCTRSKKIKVYEQQNNKEAVFAVLHKPPIIYGLNRTTWTRNLIKKVVNEQGCDIGRNAIDKIIKDAGYRFRKAREVLTSNDPEYREKLNNITKTLKKLGANDRFFSIDEFGPFAIKKKGGRRLVRHNEYPIIPQWQTSKGFLIVTAALELSKNQVTHFYSTKKDTEEMIKLLEILIKKYSGCRKIYLSWDAASWHSSKKFIAKVDEVNKYSYRKQHETPIVKLAPLPARAQFLNVIESIFSGMAQAIIHNSDYASVNEAKKAIDRYFKERNQYFQQNPKRAGNKIWGDEIVYPQFSEVQNCKNPRWR